MNSPAPGYEKGLELIDDNEGDEVETAELLKDPLALGCVKALRVGEEDREVSGVELLEGAAEGSSHGEDGHGADGVAHLLQLERREVGSPG